MMAEQAPADAGGVQGSDGLPDTPYGDLVRDLTRTCQMNIAAALQDPTKAIAFAKTFETSLRALEFARDRALAARAKGESYNKTAELVAAEALNTILKETGASVPAGLQIFSDEGLQTFSHARAVPSDPPPRQADLMAAHSPNRAERPFNGGVSGTPTFGEVSGAYLRMRIEAAGEETRDVQTLRLRRRVWIEVVGDRPVDHYKPHDLQTFVNRMQIWPKNDKDRVDWAEGKVDAHAILAHNKDRTSQPIGRKTLEDGYVAAVKTMIRHGMADHGYRDPFAGFKLRWPEGLAQSVPRESVSHDVLNRAFRAGCASGYLDEAMLPLLAYLTGRRIGLLVHLCGSDLRQKDGVWIADTNGMALVDGRWRRVPIKTAESATFFVLHDCLAEMGFCDWAERQEGYLFKALHTTADPSKQASTILNRLLKKAGARGGNREVIHSLRGDRINEMREGQVSLRANRLQAGHGLDGEHDRSYGHRALGATDMRKLARQKLPKTIDLAPFKDLDFTALAARPRQQRPRGKAK